MSWMLFARVNASRGRMHSLPKRKVSRACQKDAWVIFHPRFCVGVVVRRDREQRSGHRAQVCGLWPGFLRRKHTSLHCAHVNLPERTECQRVFWGWERARIIAIRSLDCRQGSGLSPNAQTGTIALDRSHGDKRKSVHCLPLINMLKGYWHKFLRLTLRRHTNPLCEARAPEASLIIIIILGFNVPKPR